MQELRVSKWSVLPPLTHYWPCLWLPSSPQGKDLKTPRCPRLVHNLNSYLLFLNKVILWSIVKGTRTRVSVLLEPLLLSNLDFLGALALLRMVNVIIAWPWNGIFLLSPPLLRGEDAWILWEAKFRVDILKLFVSRDHQISKSISSLASVVDSLGSHRRGHWIVVPRLRSLWPSRIPPCTWSLLWPWLILFDNVWPIVAPSIRLFSFPNLHICR